MRLGEGGERERDRLEPVYLLVPDLNAGQLGLGAVRRLVREGPA